MSAENSNLTNQSNNSEEISLKELVFKSKELSKYLLSKWRLILAAGIISGILGFTYAYFKKPIYTAVLSFALEDEKNSGLSGALGLASQFGFDIGNNAGGAFSGDNLLELMKSRSMIEKTLLTPVIVNTRQQTLVELYISFNRLHEKWDSKPELKSIRFLVGANRSEFSMQQDSVLGEVYNAIVKDNLSVDKADKKLSIIDVKVSSENELFSKYFAEILAKTVADFYIDTKTKKSVENVSILQHQTDSVRRALVAAITGVATSVDATPNLNPTRQILRTPSQNKQVDVQVNTAILSELVKNLEISKVSLRKETPLIQVIDRPILPLDKKKFGKLRGLVFGGGIGGLLMIMGLVFSRRYKTIISDES